jgi:hypothetical protein
MGYNCQQPRTISENVTEIQEAALDQAAIAGVDK